MALDLRGSILVPRASWRPEYKDQEALGHTIWSPRFLDIRSSPIQKFGGFSLKSFESQSIYNHCRTLRQEQVNAIRNVTENEKWPEVIQSKTSNPVSQGPLGPCTQSSRRLWRRDWLGSCWARQKGTRNEILESFRLEDENDYEYEIWL